MYSHLNVISLKAAGIKNHTRYDEFTSYVQQRYQEKNISGSDAKVQQFFRQNTFYDKIFFYPKKVFYDKKIFSPK